MITYRAKSGHVKLKLIAELSNQGVPLDAAFRCGIACVDAGRVPDDWREQLGDEASDAIDEDLERMKVT